MDPSSFHSQFIGFKAVIGNGEQSLKVDLRKKVHQEIRSMKPRRAKTPVLTDHYFASDIELLHVVCWALNGSYSTFEHFMLFLSNSYLFWLRDLKKYVCNIVARPVELATWVNEDLWRNSILFFSILLISKVYLVWLFILFVWILLISKVCLLLINNWPATRLIGSSFSEIVFDDHKSNFGLIVRQMLKMNTFEEMNVTLGKFPLFSNII